MGFGPLEDSTQDRAPRDGHHGIRALGDGHPETGPLEGQSLQERRAWEAPQGRSPWD